MSPLRCHLLIGHPASGKTTLANDLAPLLSGPGEPPAQVLSTDAIRAEVFGDRSVQGPWIEIQQRLHQRLQEAVAAGVPVIVDATHARRDWRLAITQDLALPAPVEWIGWWLFTPLATSLEWNQRRSQPVPEAVIRQMAASLGDPHFGPRREEGFAAIVSVVPNHHASITPFLRQELARLDQRIRSALNRQKRFSLHGYSRLLDLERLLYLLKLLSTYPELGSDDPATRAELEALLSPLPAGDLADRAAAFLRHLHGTCYGDVSAIRADLAWLDHQGFCSALPVTTPLQPPALPLRRPRIPPSGGVHGGIPSLGDGPVFIRLFTLLRHLLQQPFDRDPTGGRDLQSHLIEQCSSIPGAYLPNETASLRKDAEKIFTPYGFRVRNDNVRHGYTLGTALLSGGELKAVHGVLQQAAGRLSDPSAQQLLTNLELRLEQAGISVASCSPVRSYANHSVVHPGWVRPDSLAAPRQAGRIEAAILQRQRVVLERSASAAAFADSPEGELRIWPLQLVFHNIAWYLLYEEDPIGRPDGLIRSERLERLALRHCEHGHTRPDKAHLRALKRLERLLHHSGGIYFGHDLVLQLAIGQVPASIAASHLITLRFCCQDWAFAFIREGQQRYPLECTRFSRPRRGDRWWFHPQAPHVLKPNAATASHPYPVEFDLPPWTVERDVDLRNWLFAFGAGIRIESPQALAAEQQRLCLQALAVYGITAADPAIQPVFPNRLRLS